jgi:glucosamine kinase
MIDSAQKLFVGVDGGGTGCRAAIGTSADGVIAEAIGGRANVASDPELAIKNILDTVDAAVREAGIPKDALGQAKAHLGLAGVMGPKDSVQVAAAMPFCTTVVTDDRPTAVTGALGGQDGFLLSVGTGTIAAASVAGAFHYVGGWGFHVADQASGAWLGRATLERILLCRDGVAKHTDLTRKVFANFDNDANAIVAFSMSAKPGDYGTFAPDIVSGASAGDPWGEAIMTLGAEHLVRCLTTLGFRPSDTLCLSGGLGPLYANFLPPEFLDGLIVSCGNALDGAFQLAKSLGAVR